LTGKSGREHTGELRDPADEESIMGGKIEGLVCPRCQTHTPTDSRFCPGCGNPLAEPAPTTPPAAQPVRLLRRDAAILVAVVCLGICLFASESSKFLLWSSHLLTLSIAIKLLWRLRWGGHGRRGPGLPAETMPK
jgi:hypothetical protein